VKLTPLHNLFLDCERDIRRYESNIASIRRSMASIFRQELESKPGSIRSKAARMGVSPTALRDASTGRRRVTVEMVKKLEKLK